MNNNETSFPKIRTVRREDLPELKAVIDATGLFPGEMLDDMAAPFLEGAATDEAWLAYVDGVSLAVAYHAPERMTSGTRNLLLIAVRPDRQSEGIGRALMARVEADLASAGDRILLVETSGLPEFEATRAFYAGLGYDEEARIRDFYQDGEDKIVFRKALR